MYISIHTQFMVINRSQTKKTKDDEMRKDSDDRGDRQGQGASSDHEFLHKSHYQATGYDNVTL